jgi:hypothetical protein
LNLLLYLGKIVKKHRLSGGIKNIITILDVNSPESDIIVPILLFAELFFYIHKALIHVIDSDNLLA